MIHSRSPVEDIGQFSYPDYKYYREDNHVFTDVAAAPNSLGMAGNFENDRELKIISRQLSNDLVNFNLLTQRVLASGLPV